MLITGLLIYCFMPSPMASDPTKSVPPYFIKFNQERTLFAQNEPVWLLIRLGNQKERALKSKHFPKILKGLSVSHEGKPLTMSKNFSDKLFYKGIRSLEYGAHKDFRLNLRKYFPEMKPGNIYKVAYNDDNYDITGKNISVIAKDLPPLDVEYELSTSLGNITIKLNPEQAPNHAANFALLTQMDFYRDMIFHRVIKGFVIQTGDPLGTGMGGSNFTLGLEKSPFLKHEKYAIGMARSGNDLNSATSQFYICLDRIKDLDEKYTVFGKVTAGFEVCDKIGEVPTTPKNTQIPDKPLQDLKLYSIKVVEK